jgi:hypothetical protein
MDTQTQEDGIISERWKPKQGKEYWFIWDTGQIKNKVWGTWSYHQQRWDIGFKTREEAEHARERITEVLGNFHTVHDQWSGQKLGGDSAVSSEFLIAGMIFHPSRVKS